MSRLPAITEAEWKVMKLLWAQAPQPAYDIIQAFQTTEGWHPNTVRTLLSRLHRKKAVAARKYKNLFLYSPTLAETDFIQAESDSFLHRVFGGSVKPLLLHFAQREKLTPEDWEELRSLLNPEKE